MEIVKKIFAFFLDIIETIVVAASLFVIVYLFFLQPHQVIGNSMIPNFHDQEFILTDKISYRFRKPMRGEIVVFKSPEDKDKDFIKRIIGLPQDTVSISTGKVFINGNVLSEEYLDPDLRTPAGKFLQEFNAFVVPVDSYMVFGDNRLNSSDSRAWGPVSIKNIVGKALFVYWPPQRFRLVEEVHYR